MEHSIDKNIVHGQSLIDFKRMLQTWGGVTCSCMRCIRKVTRHES